MQESLKVHIDQDHPSRNGMQYILQLISRDQNFSLIPILNDRLDLVNITFTPAANDASVIPKTNGDIILRIFDLINCTQELNTTKSDLDQYGRYKYTSSYQYHNNCITDNLVQGLINQFIESIGLQPKTQKTKFFISHDVDFLYGSKKEDLKWTMKNWHIGDMLKIIFQEIIRRPHWRNIDKLMRINDAYDIRSTFFWLVNDGIGIDGIPNADYNLSKESNLVRHVKRNDGFNGLHKSASNMTLDQEILKSSENWIINRNHYLRFRTHEHWRAISESSIQLDCSLGYAEQYGFRNSYGLPFQPFDMENNRPYNFVEAPLHIMDATFLHYLKTEPYAIGNEVISFIEKNKIDCILSILWHNNYCTEYAYKPFLKAYKEILGYVYENQFETVTPKEILDQYLMDWDE